MNQTEATQLVTVLNRAALVNAMEGQGAVWHMALTDVPYVTAKEVATSMIATRTSDQRWVTPGDVRAAVAAKRRARLADMPGVQVPQALDGDPAREIPWRRAFIETFADTGDAKAAEQAACELAGIEVPAPVVEAARKPPELTIAHGRQCTCGCLEKPVRASEGAPR
ncbi:hypothetical protein [Isoptericola aurantiacus]|uniref:hypothetical protein n=1 Tax=Isoptericola aurantiacus TaxID=3377839 RepID=UPI00383B6C3D